MSISSPKPAEPLLTVREVANVLRIHQVTAYRLVSTGKLQSVKIGRRRLITSAQLAQFVASHTSGGAT